MKSTLGSLLIAIIICGIALAGTGSFQTVSASKDVTGIIISDTTWTKTNSPYILTGPTAIANGVTLTIEPGVTVNMHSYLQVNGTLVAVGSATEPIDFNGVGYISDYISLYYVSFTQSSSKWDEQTGSGSIIENAVLNATSISISNASPKINNNHIEGVSIDSISVDGGLPMISGNAIEGGKRAILVSSGSPVFSHNAITAYEGILVNGGAPIISNNTLTGKGIAGQAGISCAGNNIGAALIYDNNIQNYATGISILGETAGTLTIERNLIKNNDEGIYAHGSETIIRFNTIVNNRAGIQLGSSPIIIYNNIQNNNQSISLTIPSDVNVTYNWWGTTDTQAINQTIYDFKNDFNLGKVVFEPFLTEPNPQAPDPNTSIPTPDTSPYTSPSPSQNSTAITDQSGSHAASEPDFYGVAVAAVVVFVVVALLAGGAVLVRRKTR